MHHDSSRRAFLKSAGLMATGLGLGGLRSVASQVRAVTNAAAHVEKLGWRLGVHSYSFRNFTLHESIAKAAALGVRWFSGYPTQRLATDQPGVLVTAALPAAARKEIQRRLDDAGLKMVQFGVCGFDEGVDQFRALFDFAAEFGVDTIVAEPPEDAFDALEKLGDEYRIAIAIHNHPTFQPRTRYAQPETVRRICAGRSPHIGACADIGHWARSGFKPLDCLRQMEGRILASHFKDMNGFTRPSHCVPFGTGVCDVPALLAELHRQRARTTFMIEYEFNWANNLPEIAQSIAYFCDAARVLPADDTRRQN